MKKNLEIEPREEVLNQTETSHTDFSSGLTAPSVLSSAFNNVPPTLSIFANTLNWKEKRQIQLEEKNFEATGDTFQDTTVYKSEIEDLKLKLKTVSLSLLFYCRLIYMQENIA